MAQSIEDIIATAAVYRDLTSDEAADLALGLELRNFRAGEPLMVQGAVSDGAYVITAGAVTVFARLPGGGETPIADLGPGDLIGEMALLTTGGKRSATARAQGAVDALFMDRRYFEAGLHLLRPASLKVLRRLSLTIVERLLAVRKRTRTLIDAAAVDSQFRPVPELSSQMPPTFDVRAFLPILPSLRGFDAAEIDRIFSAARVEAVPRGATVSSEGSVLDTCRLIVRGALLVGHQNGKRIHQIDVLGPGRFAGVAAALESTPSGVAFMVAEDATLLTMDSAVFMDLWAGQDRLALRLLEMVTSDLVLSLTTANNHLTRLTAQARLHTLTSAVA